MNDHPDRTDPAARTQGVEIAGTLYQVTFRFPPGTSYEDGLRSVIAQAPRGPHEVRRPARPGLWGAFARKRVRHGSLMWHRAVFEAAQAALRDPHAPR